MKHKPMLFRKMETEGSGRAREIIGLVGTRAGIGVTYTGMLLAFYLGNELGRRTAFVEYCNHKDMELIQRVYEWSDEDGISFHFRNITCYKNVNSKQLADIQGENYEYIIIDFGSDFVDIQEEFLRCSLKAVIAGHSEWDILKLLSFFGSHEMLRCSETWNYLIPLAEDRLVTRLKKETHHRIWAIPYTEEPTRPNRNTKQFCKDLLRLA